MDPKHLVVRAGARARERLRNEGFHPDLFGTLVGASGGPKWLVLRHVDAILVDRLILPRTAPLDTLGSSIGSFRHACLAQSDPHAALARLEESYVRQTYAGPGAPTTGEISREMSQILHNMLGEKGADEICTNETVRSAFVAARLRNDRGRDRGRPFKLQLIAAGVRNAISRRQLERAFRRILFASDAILRDASPDTIHFHDFDTEIHPLTPDRVPHALRASGSIPLLMEGVTTTPGVPGTLFDGGIIDYHFDFSFGRRHDGLVLFAHFFDRIVPGWFDRPFAWRRPRPQALEDVVMVAPSDAFIRDLPGGKIPDRDDFLDLSNSERSDRWREVIARCELLGHELDELIETGRLAEAAQPFSPTA